MVSKNIYVVVLDYAVYDRNGNKLNTETLYERTKLYLSNEIYRVYSPYYEILDLKISNWTENEDGTEAEFFYTMTEKITTAIRTKWNISERQRKAATRCTSG